MNFFIQVIKGIAIGAGAILPGISSGVLCVIFGIYEKIIDCLLGFFKDIKKNILFLFPIILGCAIGVVIFSKLLIFLFEAFPNQTKSIFVGLILGCIPSLLKKANTPNGFKLHFLLYTIFTMLIGISSIFVQSTLSDHISININSLYLVLSGFLMSAGVVIPRSK